MTISIDVRLTDTQLDVKLTQIAFNVGNLTPAFKEIGMSVTSLVQLGFRESINPYGQPWAAIRPRRDGSRKPLLDTGRLRNSITYNADKKSVRIGTNVKYGEQHQIGLGVKKRSFLPDVGLPISWQNEIMHTLNDYLARAIAP